MLAAILATILTGTSPCGLYPHCVQLAWDASLPNGDALVYRVFRSETDGGPYTKIAGGITGLTYRDVNVSPSVTYYYVVTAWDKKKAEQSNYSNQASALIP